VANHVRVVAQEFMQEKFLVVGCSQSKIDVVSEYEHHCVAGKTTSDTRNLYIAVRTIRH